MWIFFILYQSITVVTLLSIIKLKYFIWNKKLGIRFQAKDEDGPNLKPLSSW